MYIFAECRGIEQRTGTSKPGITADFVAVDPDPRANMMAPGRSRPANSGWQGDGKPADSHSLSAQPDTRGRGQLHQSSETGIAQLHEILQPADVWFVSLASPRDAAQG